MEKYSTLVIGGGAAGICAAISKACGSESVVICEKMSQLGKKILASGNGRCNLLNDNLNETFYNPEARNLVRSVFATFGKLKMLDFFKSLGLEIYSQDSRMFPITNQASSVLKVLELELRRLSVPVEYNFNCTGLSFSKDGILVSANNGKTIICSKVIITGGGKTYPALGSDGSTYEIARQLGHKIIDPVPSAVPLVVKDSLCHVLQGQRIFATVRSIIEGNSSDEVRGELLFAKYGLSGTCILDISEEISIAINRHHKTDIFISADMIPFMDKEQLRNTLVKRKTVGIPADEMLAGILPNKFSVAFRDYFENSDVDDIVTLLKDKHFKVAGTRGWNEAEFTRGGIDVNEIKNGTLESKLRKGIYFAGEVINVNGRRGGYNLAWAWASGFVAGQTV